MRIAITGATGLVGRNLLLEIIKQNLNNLADVEVVILGKSKHNKSLQQRIETILFAEGPDYIAAERLTTAELAQFSETQIRYVDIELSEPDLGISAADHEKLREAPIDFFIHSAGLTDFRHTPDAVEMLTAVNFTGTKKMTELAEQLDIREFCYVGTAYACGETFGVIEPDYINLEQGFRNPYEQIKLEAEIVVREFQARTGMKCRYFRPSTISGRLMERELGATPKFDVFYLWAAFFLRWKMKLLNGSGANVLTTPLEMDLRFWGNRDAGLNIVPVDYVVKAMLEICLQDAPGESFHLVGDQETLHLHYTAGILDSLNITGPQFVDDEPTNLNRLESFYYKTVGKIFMPYAIQDPILFSTANMDALMAQAELSCPPIDRENLRLLLDYGKRHHFGLSGSNGFGP